MLRNSPDRRDDRAEALFATNFSAMSVVATHTVIGKRFIADKGASEGAVVFMHNAG